MKDGIKKSSKLTHQFMKNKKAPISRCNFMRASDPGLIYPVFNLDHSLCTTSIVSRVFIPINVVDNFNI